MRKFIVLIILCAHISIFSQTVTLSRLSRTITIDDISTFSNDIEILALTDLNVDASFGVGTNWDLTMLGGVINTSQYVSHGSDLDHEDVKFKATNFCESPDAISPANDINTTTYTTLGNVAWDAGVTNSPFYIVGSSLTDGDLTSSCGATVINQDCYRF